MRINVEMVERNNKYATNARHRLNLPSYYTFFVQSRYVFLNGEHVSLE